MNPGGSDGETHEWVVEDRDAGKRLDVLLAERLTDVSRAHARRVIDAGGVTVGDVDAKPATRVAAGDVVRVRLDAYQPDSPKPEAISLAILYEDAHFAVVNKPPGMVVHPGKGHFHGTLAAAVAHHFQTLSEVAGPARPGIVHRLDRDTSGAIVVARTNWAHEQIAAQFKARSVSKCYLAIVTGTPDRDRDWIDRPIGPHPHQREKMALLASHPASREAQTFYEVLERFPGYALVRAQPKTGRTHQIRLHLMSIGCPVLCDRQYGGRAAITVDEMRRKTAARGTRAIGTSSDSGSQGSTTLLTRQGLHAESLSFDHPASGERVTFSAPLPPDMAGVLECLRSASRSP